MTDPAREAGDLPVLRTERLVLRPFTLEDAEVVRRLAGDREIASTTLTIPHPYEEGMAERWIAGHGEGFAKGEQAVFAIQRRSDGALVGAVGLAMTVEHRSAELGYWIGQPYWGAGLATEAAARVIAFGFGDLALNRIYARHLTRNPASRRVLEKLGMAYEGCARQEILKWGAFEDIHHFAILRVEFQFALAEGESAR